MGPLNFPAYEFFVRGEGRAREIFDAISQRYVALTPEEWVRQHLVQYLVQNKGAPIGLIRREAPLVVNGKARRADVVVYDRQMKPIIVAECKAPSVALDQSAFDQVGVYNKKLRARFIVLTNGIDHYVSQINYVRRTFHYVDDIPPYNAISPNDSGRRNG